MGTERPEGLWEIVTEGLTPKEKLIVRRCLHGLAVMLAELAVVGDTAPAGSCLPLESEDQDTRRTGNLSVVSSQD